MPILIPPGFLARPSAKLARDRLTSEASDSSSPPGRESHIYNLYEDLSMPLSDIEEIARLAVAGKLENIQEKVDGQNITFTVRDGVLRFFTKMSLVSDRDLERAQEKINMGKGMDINVINQVYADKPGVAQAFSMAYEALEPVALQFQDTLFRNGSVVVVSGLVTSINPNTVLYDKDSFVFITPVSLTGESVDGESYNQFLQIARNSTTDAFTMEPVPTARLMSDLEEDDEEIQNIISLLSSIAGEAGLSIDSATVGDYVGSRVETIIKEKYSFIPDIMIPDVVNRFMTGKGAVANRLKKLVSSEEYQEFRRLDSVKSDIVAEAIIPLEEVIQRLGVMIIDKLDLALTASNQDKLLDLVRRVRDAFSREEILADEKTLERIRISLNRIGDREALFTRATEGIVFTYKGSTYKLTGLFTPINKLRGFFAYGAARLSEKRANNVSEGIYNLRNRFILEGGNAFRDSSGEALTTVIKLENVESTLSDFFINYLKPMGIEFYRMLGSTGKKSVSGDLDIVIKAPLDQNPRAFKKFLVDSLKSAMQGGDSKLVGGNVGVMYPIAGSQEGDYVQIDIMIDSSPDETSWLMSGTGDEGIKGVYRNLMLSHIASKRSKEMGPREKITIQFPGGLQKKTLSSDLDPADPRNKRKWKDAGERVSSPSGILDALGIPANPGEVETFEELVNIMINDISLSGYLPEFNDYISRYLASDSTGESASHASEHVNQVISSRSNEILKELYLRNVVRSIF